jgi:hypothetical protein
MIINLTASHNQTGGLHYHHEDHEGEKQKNFVFLRVLRGDNRF